MSDYGRRYVSHGRASIMHCELKVEVHCRQQFRKMAQWLVDEERDFTYRRLGTGDSMQPETYQLTIHDICWAENLVEIAERLCRYDYDSDGPEERNGERKRRDSSIEARSGETACGLDPKDESDGDAEGGNRHDTGSSSPNPPQGKDGEKP